MKVSVIIPTYNEAKDIRNCLESLEDQTLKDFEVIIVDDGSVDSTRKLVKKFSPKSYSLKLYSQNHEGPAVARNKGSLKAKGDILVFVDADMTFDEDFLRKLISPIEAGKTVGTFSKDEYVSNWDNIWARYWNYLEGWEDKKRHPKNYPDKQKVFRAIKKDIFENAGGFTKGGYTDDYTLYQKIGKEADVATAAIFYHRNPDTLNEVFHHASWVGKRKYKLGMAGNIIALIRSSLPASILKGIYRSIKHRTIMFLPFQLAYDSGIFTGILQYKILNKGAK